jgi:hypothetical protein
MIRELLSKPESRMIFSFVLGLGLSVLIFHRPRHEIDVSALLPDEIRDRVFNIDGKCYKFRIEDASCPEARVSL